MANFMTFDPNIAESVRIRKAASIHMTFLDSTRADLPLQSHHEFRQDTNETQSV